MNRVMAFWRAFAAVVAVCACLPVWAKTPSSAFRALTADGVQLIYQATDGKPCCGQVSALAELKNTGDERADDLVVEARFLGAAGQLIDASTESLFGVSIAPGETAAVRVDTRAMRPQANYASAQVRVIDARFQTPAEGDQRSAGKVVLDLLVSWGPMILLLAVWLWIVRRYSANYQKRYAELIEEQNGLLKRQVAALEALTASASKN